jgi:hypothetical protein
MLGQHIFLAIFIIIMLRVYLIVSVEAEINMRYLGDNNSTTVNIDTYLTSIYDIVVVSFIKLVPR